MATPLVQYGVAYGRGIAFGFGLQAIEASVGVGVGLIFLAREGLSFARLREMPGARAPATATTTRRPSPRRRPSMSPRALASPASLKGVLGAAAAAAALAEGLSGVGRGGGRAPVADGGEGTMEVLCAVDRARRGGGRVRPASAARSSVLLADGTRVVEAAQAIPLDPGRARRDVASSRGLGLLIRRLRDCPLVVAVGGTATMDGGAGLLERARRRFRGRRGCCATSRRALYDAPRLFGPQKGARPSRWRSSRRGCAAMTRACAVRRAGRIGRRGRAGRGARLARRRARARRRDRARPVGFDPAPYDLVVTGEGTVDDTTREGKAPVGGLAVAARRQASAASSSEDAWWTVPGRTRRR